MKIVISLLLIFVNTNFLYAQKQKTLTIGAASDFPISKKLYNNFGVGAEASLIVHSSDKKRITYNLSYLQYEFTDSRFPIGVPVPIVKKSFSPFYRLTIGVLFDLTKRTFFNGQLGIMIDPKERLQKNIHPVSLVGPTFLLPIKEKNCIRLNAALGYYGGLFGSIGASFGFKFK